MQKGDLILVLDNPHTVQDCCNKIGIVIKLEPLNYMLVRFSDLETKRHFSVHTENISWIKVTSKLAKILI